jgi:hypothetical protein
MRDLDGLALFPKVSLGLFPTPLEPWPRLTAGLNGPRLWVKRDDAVGPAMGGNLLAQLMGARLHFVPFGGDVRHRRPGGGGVPVLLAGRRQNDIALADFHTDNFQAGLLGVRLA